MYQNKLDRILSVIVIIAGTGTILMNLVAFLAHWGDKDTMTYLAQSMMGWISAIIANIAILAHLRHITDLERTIDLG